MLTCDGGLSSGGSSATAPGPGGGRSTQLRAPRPLLSYYAPDNCALETLLFIYPNYLSLDQRHSLPALVVVAV